MNEATLLKWETTYIAERVYDLARGITTHFRTQDPSYTPDPVKRTSKPPTPMFSELEIPEFRFFMYPGGKAIITPSDVARAVRAMAEEGIDGDWERYLQGKSGTIFSTKKSGYLERVCSAAVARGAEILRSVVGVERKPALEKTICQPQKQAWRVYGSELSDEHIQSLQLAADTHGTIKFRGQPHKVSLCQANPLVPAPFNQVFDLLKVKN